MLSIRVKKENSFLARMLDGIINVMCKHKLMDQTHTHTPALAHIQTDQRCVIVSFYS